MLEIVVHDLEQARAALATAGELGVAVQLRGAPDAAGYAGVGYLQALGEAVGQELAIDCGDDAGLALAALRTGCRKLVFSGDAPTAAKLADMAGQLGAACRHETAPGELLALTPEDDAGERLRKWLLTNPARGS